LKVLLDSCVSAPAGKALEEAGHDVAQVGDWGVDPGDEEVLERARADGRVLVTLDKDFGELVVVHGQAHAGIIRLVGLTAQEQGPLAVRVLALYASALEAGALVTAGLHRVRIREAQRDA